MNDSPGFEVRRAGSVVRQPRSKAITTGTTMWSRAGQSGDNWQGG